MNRRTGQEAAADQMGGAGKGGATGRGGGGGRGSCRGNPGGGAWGRERGPGGGGRSGPACEAAENAVHLCLAAVWTGLAAPFLTS
jgi:hypothetical protein